MLMPEAAKFEAAELTSSPKPPSEPPLYASRVKVYPKEAHASLSPASAADISQRAADFVFQGARLAPVLEVLSTAKRARNLSLQNFGVAFCYNIVAVPFAMAGYVTPLIAAIVMSTSSILVTLNATRLAGVRKS